jgi:hypothetical protein
LRLAQANSTFRKSSFVYGSEDISVFTTFSMLHTVQNSDNRVSSIVVPQSANHHSVTKGQVNTLQALSVQLIVISVQKFYCVNQICSKGQVQ